MVERLHISPFKRKTQVRFPGLAPSHIIHLFIVYTYILCIHGSRVSELYSGHITEPGWLWWNSMSLCLTFLSSMQDTCVNIMTWKAYIVLKGRKTPIPPQNLVEESRINALFHYINFIVFHSFIPVSEPAIFFQQWAVSPPMGLELQLSKLPDLWISLTLKLNTRCI